MKNFFIHACRVISWVVLLAGIGSAMIYLASDGTATLHYLPTNTAGKIETIIALIAIPILIIFTLHPEKNPSRDYLIVRVFPKLTQKPVLARRLTDLTIVLIPIIIGLLPFVLFAILLLTFVLCCSANFG